MLKYININKHRSWSISNTIPKNMRSQRASLNLIITLNEIRNPLWRIKVNVELEILLVKRRNLVRARALIRRLSGTNL
jgi:hypothetical protein